MVIGSVQEEGPREGEEKRKKNREAQEGKKKFTGKGELLSKKQILIWQITDLVPEIFIALSFFFFKQ